jgi:hypothetical protein
VRDWKKVSLICKEPLQINKKKDKREKLAGNKKAAEEELNWPINV